MDSEPTSVPFIREVRFVANQDDYDIVPSFRTYIVDPFRRGEEGLSILTSVKFSHATMRDHLTHL